MTIVRLACPLSVLLSVFAGCDPREADADAEPPRERARTEPSERPAAVERPPGPRIHPAPFDIRVDALRGRGDIVELELALGRPLPPTDASRPTLHVGDEVVRKSRHPDGKLDRLVFLVPREQFDRMPDGAAIELHGLALTRGPIAVAAGLDKAELTEP